MIQHSPVSSIELVHTAALLHKLRERADAHAYGLHIMQGCIVKHVRSNETITLTGKQEIVAAIEAQKNAHVHFTHTCAAEVTGLKSGRVRGNLLLVGRDGSIRSNARWTMALEFDEVQQPHTWRMSNYEEHELFQSDDTTPPQARSSPLNPLFSNDKLSVSKLGSLCALPAMICEFADVRDEQRLLHLFDEKAKGFAGVACDTRADLIRQLINDNG